jgi:ribosomal-protein-alanine N-acetyltransferase
MEPELMASIDPEANRPPGSAGHDRRSVPGGPDPRAAPPGGAPASPVIRAMRADDVGTVAEIEKDAFTSPWRPETFRALVDRPGVLIRVVELPKRGVVAYAVLWLAVDQGELANIAVAEDQRGRGLGRMLLDSVLDLARDCGVRSLFLEVRESNERAARMYAARGFREVGRRRAYYDRPREDARVLVKRL